MEETLEGGRGPPRAVAPLEGERERQRERGTTNKMQRYTIFFIVVDALHISGGFSAHHQELKNCTHSIWYVPGLLLIPLQQ
jgi:hypothetical protein